MALHIRKPTGSPPDLCHAHPQVNKATMNMLQRVEPYITWGYPNLKTVRELVYKRGYGKVSKNRIPLTDNQIIEQVGSLGDLHVPLQSGLLLGVRGCA
jgi:hypothetical protein